ncbi:hypothetical protein P153DRAFT_431514 [Dothidotthia symphoricarpi CBS 119687]|uniref:Uncharacterized protein n=1 Tax=Dothidotthia symphoricarpi CBS 119687 TaxID=1392245 RepID=A0A6A6AF77_9PLEO|nr:uncharacterized protein P153DRAFT_431514 [Dothidotthia symphoricarpi CBS 119687]KAF2129587.1 hypothetical protein P153DRAFT_431514 [Dothidotthia symphoricarpi CBS 119687]
MSCYSPTPSSTLPIIPSFPSTGSPSKLPPKMSALDYLVDFAALMGTTTTTTTEPPQNTSSNLDPLPTNESTSESTAAPPAPDIQPHRNNLPPQPQTPYTTQQPTMHQSPEYQNTQIYNTSALNHYPDNWPIMPSQENFHPQSQSHPYSQPSDPYQFQYQYDYDYQTYPQDLHTTYFPLPDPVVKQGWTDEMGVFYDVRGFGEVVPVGVR